MTMYAVQRAIFDHLRRLESGDAADAARVATEGYDLTDAEQGLIADVAVGELYERGLHPVLVNAWCRAMGWKGADYAALFRPGLADEMRRAETARWVKGGHHG